MGFVNKPTYCGQNWLEMEKTEGGRICSACTKMIVDFSKMSWSEIEAIQLANNNTVCGMYNPKQLEYWGREIPSNNVKLKKFIGLSSLTITMATSAMGQSAPIDHVLIQGQVLDGKSNQPIENALVSLKQSKLSATTDSNGKFQLVLKQLPEENITDTLEIVYGDIKKSLRVFKDLNAQIQWNDTYVINSEVTTIPPRDISSLVSTTTSYYIEKPKIPELAKWKLKSLIKGKKKK